MERSQIIEATRRQIEAGTYESEEKLDIAADRMLSAIDADDEDGERWDMCD